MWIKRLTSTSTTRAIELTAQFAEQRQNVLAENLANINTPDYQSQRLNPLAFQKSLRAALDDARATRTDELKLRGNAQFSTGADGRMQVRPACEPAPNVLFHDGTNARLEQLLAEVTQNQLTYETATTLLRMRFQGLMKAIRGRSE